MNKINYTHRFASIIIILSMTLSGFAPNSVSAQAEDELNRQINPQTGMVSFIGPESGRVLSAFRALDTFIRPQDPGRALVNQFAHEFGIENPRRDLSEIKNILSDDGLVTARYQQMYAGIPIMGGETNPYYMQAPALPNWFGAWK